ncbi:hypothetical protein BGZ46_001426 [Entomortierella lignicola]|nr:hypothetical protein BGZ46_001426 [Entomortierella lignicola]
MRLVIQVDDVQCEKKQTTYNGSLHLMPHHLIFGHPNLEIWDLSVLIFKAEKEATDVYESIQRLTCVSSVEQLYAFVYTPTPPFTTNDGWNIYDPLVEYERMGVISKNEQWRISDLNLSFTFSPTYPQVLVVPSKISDAVLTYAAKHRSKARIPALSYLHWNNMVSGARCLRYCLVSCDTVLLSVDITPKKASITRSSQPMVGLKQNRSIQDEKLIEAIFLTNVPQTSGAHPVYGSTATNLIIDARPTANAVANTAVGAGTENMENYRNCKKVYSGIDNIHVMRDSLNKLVEALQEIDTKGSVSKSALQKSGWLKHIGAIMEGALMIVKNIHICNSHVLVHCSDGWDRTAQLTSVAQVCLDPYYRTLRGFQVLVEKEWCSFGYKFLDRCGHLSNDKNFVALSATNAAANTFANVQNKFYNNKHIRETSPVFQQFLDCVFQIMQQNPTRFEYNEYFLTQLHYHVYSCQFGNFLFNCERERRHYMATTKCASIWDFINSDKEKYLNKSYQPSTDKTRGGDGGVLFPDSKPIKYWAKLFGRTDEELNAPDEIPTNALNERMTPEVAGSKSNYAEPIASTESAESRTDYDPLGIGSSPLTSQPRTSARGSNVRSSFSTNSPEGEDPWQKSTEMASKLPAALSGAFSGGFVDSLNRLTMNVRDTWYASTSGSGSSSTSASEESSTFKELRSPRSATLGRSNSTNYRQRAPLDRELRSVSGTPTSPLHTHSATSSPKHSLADLTLEHELNQSYPYLDQERDPLRNGGAFKSPANGSSSSSSSSSSRPSSKTRPSAGSNTPPRESTVQNVSTSDLTTSLPTSNAGESEEPVPEPAKVPVKELPHPLFVE